MDYGSSPPAVLAFLDPSSPLTWVLVGLVTYWLAIVALRKRDLLPSYVGTQGPILTIHTKRGREFLDRLSKPKRFWRAWANLGIGISLVVMVSMFAVLLLSAFGALQTTETTEVQQPQNVLVIPGVNDFLPLSAAPGIVFGLLVGLVVHEGAHGLLCRVEDIDIKSMGVAMLAIIPLGAFVEPDEKDQYEASRGGQTRMFAAGVTANFAVTIVAFALLFGPVAGAIAVAPGAAVGGVAPGSSAAEADIEPNDRITAIDGTPIETNDDLSAVLEETTDDEVTVELDDGERETTVERSLLVTVAVANGPTSVETGDTIRAVDGEPVATQAGLFEAVGDNEVVSLTVERADGETVERETPIGAFVVVGTDGPLADAGAPAGEELTITTFDGERVHDYRSFENRIGELEPGDEVVVAGYLDGERVEYTVTLGEHPQGNGAFLGINGASGVSGVVMSDLGVQLYPADQYLAILGGNTEAEFHPILDPFTDSFLGKIVFALFLPIVGVVGMLPFNFAGFTGGVENFYTAQGSFALFGDGTVFVLANLLFWTGWINVQLGFFNCIPAFPLDGGHILRTSTEAVLSRLPIEANRGMVRTVTTTVGLTMLVSFLLMLFGPTLFAG
ncbi:site-2 protease family protein [Natronobeatus ordinarius]|uniref:site-2 protease family protein n=1 Tax=Natronobeatus ordinarius TaxID=2963433 RepID=UPI0020CF1ACD|nr:site-2 protease family protein [Natronobeatus ordinarius]